MAEEQQDGSGEGTPLDRWVPVLYKELRALAGKLLAARGPGHAARSRRHHLSEPRPLRSGGEESRASGPPGTPSTSITIKGSDLPGWVKQNEKEKTNQIYKSGQCGIFGFAQRNEVAGQGVYWIYTVTAGVSNPKVHPPSR